jgi:hypothetical protein
MIELLDRMKADFVERPLPSLTPRRAQLPWLRGKIDKFYNDLRSRGVAVAKDTLHAALQHLADVFLT